jgi:hypothetical protein
MKYQKFMKKVMEQLTEYKGVVDTLSTSYQSEVAKREKEFEEMGGKYTPEYIKESRRNWKPSKDYSGEISAEREKHQKNALAYLDQIQKEMDGYFQVPVNPSFASTVTALKTVGAKISNREFQLLQGASGGYWDRKLLSELGANRTKKDDKVKLNGANEPERTTVDKPIPYTGVELPDIEHAYENLQNVKNAVNTAFEAYCGMNYELKDVVFPLSKATEETNAKIESAYEIKAQPQKIDTLTLIRMASSIKCFDENHSTYTAFSEMMEGLAATMPEPKRKTTLTDGDRKLIDTLINSNYPSLAQDDAIRIAKTDSRLAEILSLDERYGAGVRKALAEVSDNE